MISNKRSCPYCGGIVWKEFVQTREVKPKFGGRHPVQFFRADCELCGEHFTPEEFYDLEEYNVRNRV